MRNSKRTQNQKKRLSRVKRSHIQRGASDPDRIRQFYVYYNYIIDNFSDYSLDGQLLTRQLNAYELGICQTWITETRDVIIEDGRDYDFAALEVGVITQLQQPRNGKHFRINFTVRNKSYEEATELIHEYMDEVHGDGYIQFDLQHYVDPDSDDYRVPESDDRNRYYSTPGYEVDIENFVSGGYRKQRGAKPPKIQEQIFYVYHNYLTRDLENRQRDKTVLLTRPLSLYELGVCQKHMKQAKENLLEDGFRLIQDLKVHDVEQLKQPRNNNHFRVSITITNNTYNDAITLINSYMEGAADGENLMFDTTDDSTHKSDDRNHYENSYQNIEITDFVTDF
jgi:hypothetical protein